MGISMQKNSLSINNTFQHSSLNKLPAHIHGTIQESRPQTMVIQTNQVDPIKLSPPKQVNPTEQGNLQEQPPIMLIPGYHHQFLKNLSSQQHQKLKKMRNLDTILAKQQWNQVAQNIQPVEIFAFNNQGRQTAINGNRIYLAGLENPSQASL
mmetsp:Transcript_3479/g.3430  ORF Transcript_3479/g.3430 Transcript_3479/m.3430 type:complete len:152 (+) Transcript_3479:122-577(+)